MCLDFPHSACLCPRVHPLFADQFFPDLAGWFRHSHLMPLRHRFFTSLRGLLVLYFPVIFLIPLMPFSKISFFLKYRYCHSFCSVQGFAYFWALLLFVLQAFPACVVLDKLLDFQHQVVESMSLTCGCSVLASVRDALRREILCCRTC